MGLEENQKGHLSPFPFSQSVSFWDPQRLWTGSPARSNVVSYLPPVLGTRAPSFPTLFLKEQHFYKQGLEILTDYIKNLILNLNEFTWNEVKSQFLIHTSPISSTHQPRVVMATILPSADLDHCHHRRSSVLLHCTTVSVCRADSDGDTSVRKGLAGCGILLLPPWVLPLTFDFSHYFHIRYAFFLSSSSMGTVIFITGAVRDECDWGSQRGNPWEDKHFAIMQLMFSTG